MQNSDYNEVLHFSFQQAIDLGHVQKRYRVSFLKKNFPAVPHEIEYSGDDPVVISLSDSSDDRFTTLLYQKYTFQLLFQKETWDKRFLDVKDDKDLRVDIDVFDGVFWRPYRTGFVQGGTREPHGPAPYIVEVSATCGLSLLKTRPLADKAGRRISGKDGVVSKIEVIRSALAQTGVDLPLVVVDNLFEQAELAVGQTIDGKAAETTDPLHKATIRTELLVDENGNSLTAEDALRLVLDSRVHRLGQQDGKWWTVRAEEAAGGWNKWDLSNPRLVKAREYQSADFSAVSTTHYSYNLCIEPYINLVKEDAPKQNRTATGGFDYYSDPEVGIKVIQDFGRPKGALPNGDFNLVDSTGLPVGWYRNNITPQNGYRAGDASNTNPYRLILKGAGDEKYNEDTPFIGIEIPYQLAEAQKGHFAPGSNVKRTLKFQFRLTNTRAAKLIVVAIRKEPIGYIEYLLKKDGSWIPKPRKSDKVGILFYNTVKVNDIQVPQNNWADVTQEMEALSDVERLRIDFCVGEKLDVELPNIQPLTEYRFANLIIGTENLNITGASRVYAQPGTNPHEVLTMNSFANLIIGTENLNITGASRVYAQPGTNPHEVLTMNSGDVPTTAGGNRYIGAVLKQQPGYPETVLWYPADANTQTGAGLALGKTLLDRAAEQYAKQLMYPADSFEGTIYGDLPEGIHQVLFFQDLPKYIGNATVTTRLPHQITKYEHHLRMCSYEIGAVRMMIDEPVTPLPVLRKFWQTQDGEAEYDYVTELPPVPPNLTGQGRIEDKIKDLLPEVGVPINETADIPGHARVRAGSSNIGAEVYNGDQIVGKVRSIYRLYESLDFPIVEQPEES